MYGTSGAKELNMDEIKFEVKAENLGDQIHIVTNLLKNDEAAKYMNQRVEEITRKIMDLETEVVRESLIMLGWIPPSVNPMWGFLAWMLAGGEFLVEHQTASHRRKLTLKANRADKTYKIEAFITNSQIVDFGVVAESLNKMMDTITREINDNIVKGKQ
jgi:hypothetical protein